MFVRKKPNKSGLISVQVIDKSSGRYKVKKTIGSSADPVQIDKMVESGESWIQQTAGLLEFDFSESRQRIEQFISNIEQITVQGTEQLLGKIFDEIGFNQIPDVLFRQLVIARLCFPVSKLKTTDYLSKYQFFSIDVQQVYRYLDKFYHKQKELVQMISYEHTLRILGGQVSIVFYDVTTLYFEIDDEDDLRRTGFSKDGKHQNPQIILGLLVSVDGYPLAYDIFEGNKFEGHTMLPIIEHFKLKYRLDQLVVIADSGLLSNDNIQELQQKGYAFILGARIKAEKLSIKQQILSLKLSNGDSQIIEKDLDHKLVISYSVSRARKDMANRERGLRKLEKQLNSGRLTKANINNRGYNKFLKMEGEINLSIDMRKITDDARWDGLKGYLTNTKLTKEEIIDNYGHLWKIEKAFRISKHDLRLRPIYHRLKRRIEAHVSIAFVAYKVYKELERQLKVKKSILSPEKAIEIAKTIYAVRVKDPITHEVLIRTILISNEQKLLANLFGF